MNKREKLCNIDLNIDNYSYKELLDLFKLTYDFSEYELKQAKKIVLMTHPDKCGYDKEVFLFFSKAYKLLHSVFMMTHKRNSSINMRYKPEIDIINGATDANDANDAHKDKIDNNLKDFYKEFAHSKDFNKKFNEFFDRLKINEDNDGYNDWLKNEDIPDENIITNMDMMNIAIERKKQNLKSIILKEELNDVGLGQTNIVTSNLDNSRPTYYESNVFDKLKYDDVKRVYTETVVPVTREDFTKKEQFNSIDSYKRHRENVINSEDNEYLNKVNYIKQKQQEKITDEMRAYKMVRQDENTRNILDKWNRHFLRLKNK